MVELAIVMPLLVMLVFGVTELGRALYHQQTVTKASATGARFMARAFNILDDNCAMQGGWESRSGQAKKLVVYAGGDTPVVPGLSEDDVDISAESRFIPAPNDSVCVITVSVQSRFEGIFGDRLIPFTEIGMPILNARAEEVYIGE
jgi:hypothetical protein